MKFFLSLFISSAALAFAEPRTLQGWFDLPGEIQGHVVTLVTPDGQRIGGTLLQKGLTDFTIDVSSTFDETRFPKGKQTIPHHEIAELHTSFSRKPFRAFADPAFIIPLDCAIHADGLFTLLAGMGGQSTPWPLKAIDSVTIPFWLGWAATGLAATPVVAPIRWLQGSVHYDFRVR